jgi:hypothetical protein
LAAREKAIRASVTAAADARSAIAAANRQTGAGSEVRIAASKEKNSGKNRGRDAIEEHLPRNMPCSGVNASEPENGQSGAKKCTRCTTLEAGVDACPRIFLERM